MMSLFKKKTLFNTILILIIVIISSIISIFKLRANSYGLTPIKPPQQGLIQQGDYSYLKEYITAYIKERMKQKNVVGISIALVDHQELVWAEGFGYQNKEGGIIATDKSIYNLASVTKVITATAIM